MRTTMKRSDRCDPVHIGLNTSNNFDPVGKDPRFRSILKKMGLE